MLPTLYGKKSLQTTLSRMASGERLAQSFLFYGDAGLGRKTVAHWFSALLLCEHPENGQPCGHCKSCHNLQKDCHPDLILVPHSGKLGGFSVETVRQICSSVSIPPNNGSRKVYLFLDCGVERDCSLWNGSWKIFSRWVVKIRAAGEIKSFSVQQFFKNAAEVWASRSSSDGFG